MELGIKKIEALLRLCAILILVLTACLVGFDSQTKVIFYVEKASFKDLPALIGLTYITSLAAAYNLLQLSYYSFSAWCKGSSVESSRYLAWLHYVFDQAAVYVVFAGTLAALAHSLLVVTGENNFQWLKWCNRYTRFCFQIGGSLLCSCVASLIMVFIASISAFNLFRLYSPKRTETILKLQVLSFTSLILLLKGRKRIGIGTDAYEMLEETWWKGVWYLRTKRGKTMMAGAK